MKPSRLLSFAVLLSSGCEPGLAPVTDVTLPPAGPVGPSPTCGVVESVSFPSMVGPVGVAITDDRIVVATLGRGLRLFQAPPVDGAFVELAPLVDEVGDGLPAMGVPPDDVAACGVGGFVPAGSNCGGGCGGGSEEPVPLCPVVASAEVFGALVNEGSIVYAASRLEDEHRLWRLDVGNAGVGFNTVLAPPAGVTLCLVQHLTVIDDALVAHGIGERNNALVSLYWALDPVTLAVRAVATQDPPTYLSVLLRTAVPGALLGISDALVANVQVAATSIEVEVADRDLAPSAWGLTYDEESGRIYENTLTNVLQVRARDGASFDVVDSNVIGCDHPAPCAPSERYAPVVLAGGGIATHSGTWLLSGREFASGTTDIAVSSLSDDPGQRGVVGRVVLPWAGARWLVASTTRPTAAVWDTAPGSLFLIDFANCID